MSKYVKDLVCQDLRRRLDGVQDAVLLGVAGMDASKTFELRQRLRDKQIQLMMVKNSLARRATEGTTLRPAFEGVNGTVAVAWGAEDFVSLVKEVVELDKDEEEFPLVEARGGVMDGEQLSPDRVREISKWPNRLQQLSILSGQISGVASTLSGQLIAVGGALASQIEKIAEREEGGPEEGGAEEGEADA